MDNIDFTIVKMSSEHIPQVYLVEEQSFKNPWSKKSFCEALENPDTVFFTAMSGKMVIGYIGMYKLLPEADITNVAVLAEYRKRGIASALIKKLICTARELCIEQIYLEVRESNITAQSIYLKAGFEVCGKRKNYYFQPKEDALIMVKKLS